VELNILITNEGIPQLCDLIRAKMFVEWEQSRDAPGYTHIIRYFAPDLLLRLDGEPLHTLETDIYALGCVGLNVSHRCSD
jgi:hypothetical protein